MSDPGQLLGAVRGALAVRLAGRRVPLAARIQVTSRCSSACLYCTPPADQGEAMDTAQLRGILDELAGLGCLRISFSGGEPMMRQDIGALVDHCAELGMSPEMNTSGAGLAERVGDVSRLELLKLSLDGPEQIHDTQRGRQGSYQEVSEALVAARGLGIRTVLVATITRYNVEHLEHLLELARQHDAMAAFQPIKSYYKGGADVADLMPLPGAMQRAVSRLRRARRDGMARWMRNSDVALGHLASWPDYPRLRCWAGRMFCIIGADGTVYPCDRVRIDTPLPSCLDHGLEVALARLPDPRCEGCGFCGALEINLAMSLEWRIAGSLLRLLH